MISYIQLKPQAPRPSQMVHSWQRPPRRRFGLGAVTVGRDDGTVLVISQTTGAMADAAKPWSSAFVPPSGTGVIPDALRAKMKAAVDQADAWLIWSQHYGLNWVVYRTPAGGGTPQVLQQATASGTPVLVTQPAASPAPAATMPTGAITPAAAPDVVSPEGPVTPAAPAAPAAPSWFAGSTDIFGVQIPNVAMAGGVAILGLLFLGGGATAAPRRGRR